LATTYSCWGFAGKAAKTSRSAIGPEEQFGPSEPAGAGLALVRLSRPVANPINLQNVTDSTPENGPFRLVFEAFGA